MIALRYSLLSRMFTLSLWNRRRRYKIIELLTTSIKPWRMSVNLKNLIGLSRGIKIECWADLRLEFLPWENNWKSRSKCLMLTVRTTGLRTWLRRIWLDLRKSGTPDMEDCRENLQWLIFYRWMKIVNDLNYFTLKNFKTFKIIYFFKVLRLLK